MGTVICHPLDPRTSGGGGSGPVEVITDITSQCHHCVSTCLPRLIVGHHGERYKRHRSSNIPSSDSAYVLAYSQPKIVVTENYLDSQKGVKANNKAKMGDTEDDGDKSPEHYELQRPKEVLHKCKSDPGYNKIMGIETSNDLVTEHVRRDQISVTSDNAGVDKDISPRNEQNTIPYDKTNNCSSSLLAGNISSRSSIGNVADTINCGSSGVSGDGSVSYDVDENIQQNVMYSRGSFSTRSLRYPSSFGANSGISGYHLTGGTTTRKCVLTLDGYSYVIVASSPENRINNRDDSVPAPPVLDRRGCEKTKSNCTTSTQNPLDGQVAKQGGLTIVRRCNSRKGNISYPGATTPTSDEQPLFEQHLLPSNSGDDQQLLETTFITGGTSKIIPSGTTNTFGAIDQLTSEQYSSSANTKPTTIVSTNMQTATIKSNNSATTTPTIRDNAEGNDTTSVTGYTTLGSYGDIDIESIDLATETLPAVDTPDACDKAAVRLRSLLRLLQRGEISAEVLQKNLHYAARVLEAVFIDETNQKNSTRSPRSSRINSTTISENIDNNSTKQGQINEKTEKDQENVPINKSTIDTTTNCNISNNKTNNFSNNNNNNSSSSSINNSNISNNKTSSCYESDAQAINNPIDITNQISSSTGIGRTKGVSTAPQTHSGPTGPPLSLLSTTQVEFNNSIVVKCDDDSVSVGNIINNSKCSADGNNINSGNQNIDNSSQIGGSGGVGVSNKTTVQRRRLRAPVWAKSASTKIYHIRVVTEQTELSSAKLRPRRLADEDDELSEVQPDAVPPEVREWLASTFTRQLATARKRSDEKPKFRSVAHAIRAGIFVDRIYRRVSSSALMQFPPEVVKVLKTLDDWSFDVFALAEAANGQPVKYLGYDLLNRYGMIHKFKIPPATLEIFLNRIEEGYCRFHNPYHNNLHAADVTQTTHHILCQTGLMNWLTDLEIFATLLAALIHDFEHTGTTNNFHVMSGSETAMLYNDRAVLENHHISAAFRVLKEDDANVLANLSREEYRELRTLIIDMVLSTDMSYHFQQLKNMKNLLTIDSPTVDKSKALSLVLHCCDISHPAKKWSLHHRWTMLLLEEFFRQGDLERELGLPFSPLCDRNNTLVAESQIGFIDFIVDPSMTVCSDMLEYILAPITPIGGTNNSNKNDENVATDINSVGGVKKANSITSKKSCEPITEGVELSKNGSTTDADGKQKFRIRKPWNTTLAENKKIWKEQAVRDAEARAAAATLAEGEENKDGVKQDEEKTEVINENITATATTTTEQQD